MLAKKIIQSLLFGGLVIGLVGCSSSIKHTGSRTASANQEYRQTQGASVGSIEFYEEEISPEEEQRLLSTNTLYFGYDKFEITPENKKVIIAHAKKLAANPNLKLRIDGHTDERGSREYNIGLGERRAKAVSKILATKGVSSNQVVVVSYGKEKPAVIGENEYAWSKNRRAELEYEGR